MKYRVQLLRVIEQDGVIELEADSADEARDVAVQLTDLPGAVVKQPDWGDFRKRHTQVIGVSEAA